MSQFAPVPYAALNSRQKENYNFHKIAARMADYGFNCLRLTDDWQGADFIACHIDGDTFLKVQLKGRLVIDRKYQGKGIHVAFILGDAMYLYDHDKLVGHLEANGLIGEDSVTWHENGLRSWPSPPAWAINFLEEYRI
jgi:GNAT superfamily N-acetyltransferase